MPTNIPKARYMINSVLPVVGANEQKMLLDALSLMTRKVTKQGNRVNFLDPAGKLRILNELAADDERHDTEIAEAAGYTGAAGARVSEIRRGLK